MSKIRHFHPIVKWVFTLFLLILVPSYWVVFGPENFLWISDVALFLLYVAVICESRFLASIAIVGDIVYATAWTVDFVYTLFASSPGFTEYMIDDALPLGVRALSLFHVALPPLMIWVVRRLGYDFRAWRYQIVFSIILLFITWLISTPSENINLVYSYQRIGWDAFPYLMVLSIANAAIVFLTHCAIRWAARKKLL